MTVTGQTPADWYPDPLGRHELRYWDGAQWTEHVSSQGQQSVSPIPYPPPLPTSVPPAAQVPQQTPASGPASRTEPVSEPLLTASVLIVSQQARVVRSNVEYAIKDQDGRPIGTVKEVGRGFRQKRRDKRRGRTDANRAYELEVVNSSGRVLLAMSRPHKWAKSAMTVKDANGAQIGQIRQETLGVAGAITQFAELAKGFTPRLDAAADAAMKSGNARFALEAGGRRLGSIYTENTRALDFRIEDASRREIGRVTKTRALKSWFTNADDYVVEIHEQSAEPLSSLVIASALAVDLALRQHDTASARRTRRR